MEDLLRKFKNIEPNQDFKAHSRTLILNTPQTEFHPKIFRQFLNSLQYGAAFSLTAIFIFLILGGLSILNKKIFSPALLSSLDPENISAEEEKLNIQIQLSQAEYFSDSAKKIEVALRETAGEFDKSKNRGAELNKLLNELTL
ncbi:MAG: hypothetical protein Q7S73_00470 [bacterium]|nr:hypothetical protein [bacterium]